MCKIFLVPKQTVTWLQYVSQFLINWLIFCNNETGLQSLCDLSPYDNSVLTSVADNRVLVKFFQIISVGFLNSLTPIGNTLLNQLDTFAHFFASHRPTPL
jgi:hypothetical protein